jgi:hypothetical protein
MLHHREVRRTPFQRKERKRPLGVLGLLTVAVAMALTACDSTGGQTASSDERFWSNFRTSAREAENFPSLKDMEASADAVVTGRFGPFAVGRTIQGDAAEDVVVFLETDFRIGETLAGTDYGSSVPLEFLGPADPNEADDRVQELNASLPAQRMVVFVRDKGGSEAGLFRVVNSTGLWAATSRSPVDTPLAFEVPQETGLYARELARIGSIQELIEYIRGA